MQPLDHFEVILLWWTDEMTTASHYSCGKRQKGWDRWWCDNLKIHPLSPSTHLPATTTNRGNAKTHTVETENFRNLREQTIGLFAHIQHGERTAFFLRHCYCLFEQTFNSIPNVIKGCLDQNINISPKSNQMLVPWMEWVAHRGGKTREVFHTGKWLSAPSSLTSST